MATINLQHTELRPEKRIELYPYDLDAWNILLRDAQKKHVDSERQFYERLVAQFPNAGRFWKAYIEHELKARNYENVEKLFQRCLMKVLNIELWKCYLNYVRETKGNLPSFREKMAQAYDFAIEKMGIDSMSSAVYQDYISFLKNVPAVGSYAENQKITAVRKIYQRAVITPLQNVEQIWNEYCSFEKSVNPQLAEKLISERSKDYNIARKVSKVQETMLRGINRTMISVPPKGSPMEAKQVDMWKKYINWEKSNPMGTEDYHLYAKRIIYSYEQALLNLGYYPDIWYEEALFMQEASKTLAEKGQAKSSDQLADEVSALYERAITTMLKENMLIYFAYADYEEERMKFEKCRQIYNRFIDMQHLDPTLAFIQYMKMARRTEGIKKAREIFKKAREDPRVGCQVFVASALMEYYCSKDTSVAFRIFDLGLKKYGDSPEYALAYIDYLSHLNEDNNTRVLFERILTSGNLPAENSVEVWDKYLEFESLVGDLPSTTKVDKRRRQALEKEFGSAQTVLLVDRYKFMDLYPISFDDMKALGYAKMLKNLQPSTQRGMQSLKNPADTEKGLKGAGKSIHLAPGYPKPDTGQMIPFKPKLIATSTYHPVPGGVFPPPPAIAHLLTLCPPPFCFNGPFVGIDILMEKIRDAQLPDESAWPNGDISVLENGAPLNPKLEDIKKEFYNTLATVPDPLQVILSQQESAAYRKRAAPATKGDSDDEGGGDMGLATAPPSQDIYRMRQQIKRIK